MRKNKEVNPHYSLILPTGSKKEPSFPGYSEEGLDYSKPLITGISREIHLLIMYRHSR